MATQYVSQLHSCQVPYSNGAIAATAEECVMGALQITHARSVSFQSFSLLPSLMVVDTDCAIDVRDEDVSVIDAHARS